MDVQVLAGLHQLYGDSTGALGIHCRGGLGLILQELRKACRPLYSNTASSM